MLCGGYVLRLKATQGPLLLQFDLGLKCASNTVFHFVKNMRAHRNKLKFK